jgi:hypothetical protein
MFLVEILLPLRDEKAQAFPAELYESLAQLLTERFGGVTSFARSPAEGRWKQGGATARDDIVVIEVMAEQIERPWWAALRRKLMREFRQEDVVIRAHAAERLT